MAHRRLDYIAAEIRQDWGTRISPHARPYLDAMSQLNCITDNYYADSAKSVVLYFLSNAAGWRGDTARRIKAELNTMLKETR